MSLRIAHVTTAHDLRTDTRILRREASSQAGRGHDVHVVGRGLAGLDIPKGVTAHELPSPRNRLERVARLGLLAVHEVRRIEPDIVHFHDPELMPFMWSLRRSSRKVVYDAHEDLPRQMLTKPYIRPEAHRMVSGMADLLLRLNCRRVDGVVCATAGIEATIATVPTVVVQNFPRGSDAAKVQMKRDLDVLYVGVIGRTRGLLEAVEAMGLLDPKGVRLTVAGPSHDPVALAEASQMSAWDLVDYLGPVPPSEAQALMARSRVGLCTLHPTDSYVTSLPTKLFEYLLHGVPVIASDFPLWRSLIDEADCAIFVDPNNPQEIADAIDGLVSNPEEAIAMGERGRDLVREHYSWESQAQRLEEFYGRILRDRSTSRARRSDHESPKPAS